MKKHSYETGLGFSPNPVFEAAEAFLASAEREYQHQSEAIESWLDLSNWFVVHHLSVIATELFLKSFHVVVSHGPVVSEDGPDDEVFKHAFVGHSAKFDQLPQEVVDDLKEFLSRDEYSLLQEMSPQQIARGRYPYEEKGGIQNFPSGNQGKELSLRWLQLARSMRAFYSEHPSPFADDI